MTDALTQKERQLQLILAIDQARDGDEIVDDPGSMFHIIARLLKQHFNSDAAAIMLLSEASDEPAVTINVGVPDDVAIELCRQAMDLDKPAPLNTSVWPYSLGMRIVLAEETYPLGGLFVARSQQPFDVSDAELLLLAESQLDSAIIQARLLWRITQRNLELETIYQIDRMRDDNPDESDLVSSFAALLVERFRTELCMVMLNQGDDGDLTLRRIVDKRNFPARALEAIVSLTADIRSPQTISPPPDVPPLVLVASPFIVSGQKIGAVVIGRETPFSTAEHRLLYAMTSQMDSAIVHSQVMQQLVERNKELEAIYRIDRIRDSEHDFDKMLHRVLDELCKVVAAEFGFLMLYNEKKEEQLELKATTDDDLLKVPDYVRVIERFAREALNTSELIFTNQPDGPFKSIIAIPLILNETIIGVFGMVNSANPRGFTVHDRRMLKAITSQVDTAVFERLERRRMRNVLSRSVDPKVLEHLLQRAHDTMLAGERVVLSVIFADIRGSTEWAERTDPEELVFMLNRFLGSMTDIIFQHGGTLDKYVGDEVIALFGCPVYMEDHAYRAAACALEMQTMHRRIQGELRMGLRELPPMGIGISSGEVIAGEFGHKGRTDFTAIGRAMNLGARLCGAAHADEIYISQTTYDMIRPHARVEQLEPLSLKGIGSSVPVYKLLSVKP